MAASKTSLSAGELIRAVLIENLEVSSRITKVYPVVEDTAELPYIVYRRSALEKVAVKNPQRYDSAEIQVQCFTRDYTEGVELAEAVRAALDGIRISLNGLTISSCELADSEESWADDAFVQTLVFNCKI